MADINLLPEEFRSQDSKELADARKKPAKVELTLTSPKKSSDITTKKGFWKKIFPGGGGITLPEREKKDLTKLEPAQKKIKHKKAPIGGIHVPSFGSKDDEKDKVKESIKEEKKLDDSAEKKKLVNPHMSEFQNKSEKSMDASIDPIVLHTPEIETKEPSIKASHVGEPKITFDKPGKDNKAKGSIGKVFAGMMKSIYKVKRSKNKSGITVNLMPERRISFKDINWSRIVRMLIVSIGGAAGITVVWYLVLLDQERREQQEFSDLQLEIARLKGAIILLRDEQKEALVLKNKLDIAATLLDGHIYWTQFFALLESLTLDGVYFDGLTASITDDSVLSLSGTADTQETVFWQRETFKESIVISDVVVLSTAQTIDDDGKTDVTFTLEMVIDRSVWRK